MAQNNQLVAGGITDYEATILSILASDPADATAAMVTLDAFDDDAVGDTVKNKRLMQALKDTGQSRHETLSPTTGVSVQDMIDVIAAR